MKKHLLIPKIALLNILVITLTIQSQAQCNKAGCKYTTVKACICSPTTVAGGGGNVKREVLLKMLLAEMNEADRKKFEAALPDEFKQNISNLQINSYELKIEDLSQMTQQQKLEAAQKRFDEYQNFIKESDIRDTQLLRNNRVINNRLNQVRTTNH